MNLAKVLETFHEEATELISGMEQALVSLEKNPKNNETIHQIFRALHTLKGSGAMLGLNELSDFAHEFENLFDRIRKNELEPTSKIIDVTLKACDQLRLFLNPEALPPEAATRTLLADLSAARGQEKREAEPGAPSAKTGPQASNPSVKTYFIRFQPNPNYFENGADPLNLLDDLRRLGPCQVTAHPSEIPLENLDPESCQSSWSIALQTISDETAIQGCFQFVADRCVFDIEERGVGDGNLPGQTKIGEILIHRGLLKEVDLQGILAQQKKVGEIAISQGLVAPDTLHLALAEQSTLQALGEKQKEEQKKSSIRVKSEKVDELVNLVGELVTLHSRFAQTLSHSGQNDLRGLTETLGRLSEDLRQTTMGIRMVPVEDLFRGFQRMVRDLAQELGKEVELNLVGCETELDRHVIDSLKDPLVHTLRNAIDHGIERPQQRLAAGKPKFGTITLTAKYEGAQVLMTVEDDGAGLDPVRILQKAKEKGLVKEGAALTTHEIIQLIFLPGFSTAAEATRVSGRGVGMDVVKKNIEHLRGHVEARFEPGKGTRIDLHIPLTLAIIDGLLTRLGNESFILNLSHVDECVDLTPAILATSHGHDAVMLRGDWVPFIRLREYFEFPAPPVELERMVISRIQGKRIGLVVDEVVGQHQSVIKPLGAYSQKIQELAGATILGDGTVALVIDAMAICLRAMAGKSLNEPSASEPPGGHGPSPP